MTKSKNSVAQAAVMRRRASANRPKAADYFPVDDVHDEVDAFNKNREKVMLSGQAQAGADADDDDQVFQNRSVLGLDDDFDDGFDDYDNDDGGDDNDDGDESHDGDEQNDDDEGSLARSSIAVCFASCGNRIFVGVFFCLIRLLFCLMFECRFEGRQR
jgi:hypothetical protein